MYAPATNQLPLTAPESLPRPEGHELFQSLKNCTNVTRIIKTISKGVVFIISPSSKRLHRRSSYLRYNQYKHCGFVAKVIRLDRLEVSQTTVTCLNW